jgi:transposase-like protein
MVRPGRDHLAGWIEVDETYVGGWEEGMPGRRRGEKSLVVIAAQVEGNVIGRIRMRVIPDASAGSLHPFIESSMVPGSTIHTDGWQGYASIAKKGFAHEISPIRGRPREASKLLPHVHRVASLLKRWLLGTHQGAVEPQHLPYYLDEFTFRFNRRTSKSRGKLFYRLMQQAVATGPTTYAAIVKPPQLPQEAPQPVGAT